MFGSQVNEVMIASRSANVLSNLRDALKQAQDLHAWVSAQSEADLTALGFTTADVATLKAACADANELASLYLGNALDESYTLPYNFSASQRQVIGPQ